MKPGFMGRIMAMYFGSVYSTPVYRYGSLKPLKPGTRGLAAVVVILTTATAGLMVKPPASDACRLPVETATVTGPVAAAGSMVICAVAVVALVTVTGPV